MTSKEITFVDGDVAEGLPLAGLTVAVAKQQLRMCLNVPYFADALVNGRPVLGSSVLRAGDRLEFRKRFGVKGGDDRRHEEREANGLIHSYANELVRLTSTVQRLTQRIDILLDKWANERFGQPDTNAAAVLAEVLKRLESIEARVTFEKPLNQREADIVEALGNETLTGELLARRAGYEYDGYFKSILASLVKRGVIGNKHPGYFRRRQSGPGQD